MRFLDSKLLLNVLALAGLALYLSPFVLYGQSVALPTFDNLDSKIVLYKVLAESGMLFAPSMAIVPNMMDGLPRLSYGSEWNMLVWLFVVLKPFHAYVANELLMHMTAFFSMTVLLRHYFVPSILARRHLIIASASFLFALSPFWFSGGLSVPVMPLVLYAFLQIRNKRASWGEWIVLLLVPLYSNLVLVYFFFLTVMMLWGLFDWMSRGKINGPFFIAVIFMGLVYLGVEYRLVSAMLLESTFVSHRTEFVKYYGALETAYRSAHLLFLNGEEHSSIRLSPYVIGTVIIAMLLSFKKNPFSKKDSLIAVTIILATFILGFWDTVLTQKLTLPILLLFAFFGAMSRKGSGAFLLIALLVQIVFAYEYALWFYEGMQGVAQRFPFIEMFNMSRFYFMAIPLWGVMSALAFSILSQKLKYAELIIGFVVLMQAAVLFDIRPYSKTDPYDSKIGFEQYYAPALFERVAQSIGKPQDSYRVVSLGIQPLVAVYNGFYTLDGYSTNYPLAYKYRFRPVIARNLARYPGNRKMYDEWGSKCYLYAGNIGYIRYFPGAVLETVEIDTNYLKWLGGRYVLSGYEIANTDIIGMELLDKFRSDRSHWDVFVYKVTGTPETEEEAEE